MATVIPGRFQVRRDLAANWSNPANNPILADGEIGYEKDTRKMKLGDGTKRWNQLPYFEPVSSVFFDGGTPTSTYANGPVFDMGGVN
jgi:hypothetical protein